MRDRCLPLLVSAPGTRWHDDPGPPAAITRRRKLALWQGARGTATAHRVCEDFSQVVVSTCPSEYRWVVIARSPQPVHTDGVHSPAFANAVPTPARAPLQAPISLILLILAPDASGAWRPRQPAPRGVWGGCPPTFVGVPPMAPPLCAADFQGHLHLPHVPSIIIAVSGR